MNIASYIDHTLLSPTATLQDIIKLCEEAMAARFAAVCIPPYYVLQAYDLLKGTGVKVATVIGFPYGYSTTESKQKEIENALADGADELDMVHNLAALKSGDWNYLDRELTACTALMQSTGKKLKLIVESGVLTNDELKQCCTLYSDHAIDFLKTSTGYASVGATVQAVQYIRRHLKASISIKASGGIRSFAFAQELILAGADRLGCSASMKILEESK